MANIGLKDANALNDDDVGAIVEIANKQVFPGFSGAYTDNRATVYYGQGWDALSSDYGGYVLVSDALDGMFGSLPESKDVVEANPFFFLGGSEISNNFYGREINAAMHYELIDDYTAGSTSDLTGNLTKDVISDDSYKSADKGDSVSEAVYLGQGNDTVGALAGDDTVVGGDGNDSLHGGSGDDLIYGDYANVPKYLYVGSYSESRDSNARQFQDIAGIKADSGKNIPLYRFALPDEDTTLTGNDTLNGAEGSDTLDGGAGDDVLAVMMNEDDADQLTGGKGGDIFVLSYDTPVIPPSTGLLDTEDKVIDVAKFAVKVVVGGLVLKKFLPGPVGSALGAGLDLFGAVAKLINNSGTADDPPIATVQADNYNYVQITDFNPREDYIILPLPASTGTDNASINSNLAFDIVNTGGGWAIRIQDGTQEIANLAIDPDFLRVDPDDPTSEKLGGLEAAGILEAFVENALMVYKNSANELVFEQQRDATYSNSSDASTYSKTLDPIVPNQVEVPDGNDVGQEAKADIDELKETFGSTPVILMGNWGGQLLSGDGNPHIRGTDDNDAVVAYSFANFRDFLEDPDTFDPYSVGDGGRVLEGLAGDDGLYGGMGDESLYGGAGADYIYAGGGDNHLYGGTERDTFHFDVIDIPVSGGTTTVNRIHDIEFYETIVFETSYVDQTNGRSITLNTEDIQFGKSEPEGDVEGNITIRFNSTYQPNVGGDPIRIGSFSQLNIKDVNLPEGRGFEKLSDLLLGEEITDQVLPDSDKVGPLDGTAYSAPGFSVNYDNPDNPTQIIIRVSAGFGTDEADVIEAPADFVGSGFSGFNVAALGGDDSVTGTSQNDTLDGGTGNDTLQPGFGFDSIIGGDGTDRLSFANFDAGVRVSFSLRTLDPPNNVVSYDGQTTDAAQTLFAGRVTGVEEYEGTAFDDSFVSTQLDEAFFMGDGDDTVRDGSAALGSSDTIDGGAGDGDVIDYSSQGAVRLVTDFSKSTDQIAKLTLLEQNIINTGIESTNDTAINIEKIIGSPNDDSITGGSSAMSLAGSRGDDTIRAGTTEDTLLGGDGADALYGVAGDFDDLTDGVTFDGGAGDDTLYTGGVLASENLTGGDDVDTADYSNNDLDETRTIGGLTGTLVDFGIDADLSAGIVEENYQFNTSEGAFRGVSATDTLSGVENLIGSSFSDTITGDSGDNVLSGEDGNDTINGGAGSDTINGGDGNDLIQGGAGADELNGDAGNDTFVYDGTADSIDGGDGSDSVSFAGATGAVVVSFASDKTATVGGLTLGFSNVENITGSSFDDVLAIGEADANGKLEGGEGNDTLVGGGLSDDTLDGGAGSDTADYSKASTQIFDVNLAIGQVKKRNADGGSNGVDRLIDIETIIATPFDDVFGAGASDNMTVVLGDGDDRYTGGSGDEIIDISGGNDTVSGGGGIDTLRFGSPIGGVSMAIGDTDGGVLENDASVQPGRLGYTVFQNTVSGFEVYELTEFNDSLSGSNLVDETVSGYGGDDTIRGNGGDDVIDGGAGDDLFSVALADEMKQRFDGNGNELTITGDSITGGTGEDTLNVNYDDGRETAERNRIDYSVSGENLTIAGYSYDLASAPGDQSNWTRSITRLTGVEEIFATTDPDGSEVRFFGNLSDAGVSLNTIHVNGNVGDDLIDGSGMTDMVRVVVDGGDGDDTLIGGNGNDIIRGGSGSDVKYGGAGIDRFVGSAESFVDGGFVGDLSDGETLVIEGYSDAMLFGGTAHGATELLLDRDGDGAFDTTIDVEGDFAIPEIDRFEIERIDGNLHVTLAHNIAQTQITDGGSATAGNDAIAGSNDDDTISGGEGEDTLDGNGGDDLVDGGADDDVVRGEDGNDTLSGDGGADFIDGGHGNDLILGGDGGDILEAESGDDIVLGGDGDDFVEGWTGNDLLDGGDGADTLLGEGGDDTLLGGLGADEQSGGAGADLYQGTYAEFMGDLLTIDAEDAIRIIGWDAEIAQAQTLDDGTEQVGPFRLASEDGTRFDDLTQQIKDGDLWLYGPETTAPAGASTPEAVTVTATGSNYRGNPEFSLLVNGQVVATDIEVSARPDPVNARDIAETLQSFTFALEPGTEIETVGIHYGNDRYGGTGMDRDLIIDRVEIDGQTYRPGEGATFTPDKALDPDHISAVEETGRVAWNGVLEFEATQQVVVTAAGEAYRGTPAFDLMVNGEVVAKHVKVAAGADMPDAFVFNVDKDLEIESVGIAYVNDAWSGSPQGGDRNLFVESLTVDGKTYDPGEQTVYETPARITEDQRAAAETTGDMYWNGVLTFATTEQFELA